MIDWNDNAVNAVYEFYKWANLKHRAGCSADTDKFFSELDVNRPSQTKTVADAEQECEKWTHTLDGRKCKIIINKPDVDEDIVVLCKEGDYQIVDHEALKPIKPKLTKAEAWDILMARQTNSSEVNNIKQKYEII
jgi:TusA-related sulfurtransferase